MKTKALTALAALLIYSGVSFAQSKYVVEDDLYYQPTEKSKVEQKAKTVVSPASSSARVAPTGSAYSSPMSEDAYNRRPGSYTTEATTNNQDNGQLTYEQAQQQGYYSEDGQGYYHGGFSGSQNDFEYAERIRRFHNPKFTIHISDPGFNNLYFMNPFDWNIYIDNNYAWVTPTWTNSMYWNYMYGPSYSWGWNRPWGWNSWYGPYGNPWGRPHYPYWGWNRPHYPGYYPPYYYPSYRPHPSKPSNRNPYYGSGNSVRPSTRPSNGYVRPSNSTRPSTGVRPSTTTRPSTGVRPSTTTRPSTGVRPSTTTRPSNSTRPTTVTRPSTSTRPSTVTRPSTTTRPTTTRPTSQPSSTSRPSTNQGSVFDRPSNSTPTFSRPSGGSSYGGSSGGSSSGRGGRR